MTRSDRVPYRRTISTEESRAAWAGLAEHWGVGGSHYWYPLSGVAPPHTIAVYADAFDKTFGPEPLRTLVAELGVSRLLALSESGFYDVEYEIDLVLLNPQNTSLEAFWTPHDQEWVIYASHENSLTFSGERLVEALKARWTGWEKHIWYGWERVIFRQLD